MLTRDQILGAAFRSRVVETPIGAIRVRVMSGAAREAFEAAAGESRNTGTIRAHWVALTACDDEGKRLFGDEDIGRLADLDADVLMPLFAAALDLNGMTAASVEAAEKNS